MSSIPGARPRASLARILDDLGATLLDLVRGDPEHTVDVSGVVIHDRVDAPSLPPHALMLGVGLDEPAEVVDVLEQLGRAEAAALVLRAPVPLTPAVRAAADTSQVALIGLSRGVPWAHLAAMLRSLLAEDDVGQMEDESLGGMPSGDLFAVANAVAALLDAPITIEDRSSRVLAFSGRQDEADSSRVETILGRQVPERFSRVLSERGVFRELHRSDQPVYIYPLPNDPDGLTMPRVAVAVRAGDQFLGSIWAAVHGPLSDKRAEAMLEAAKLVALHLMRVRAGADVRRRLRTDLLSSVLEGGVGAHEALERLGLARQPLVVLAVAVRESVTEGAAVAQELERLGDALAVHLGAVQSRAAAAQVGAVVYGLVPVPTANDDGEHRVVRMATDFLHRVGDRMCPIVGIGPVARDLPGIVHARDCADRALRVLRERRSGSRIARLADVQVEALILEMRDLATSRGDRPSDPLARLIHYDGLHQSNLLETLQAWLDFFGDVTAASETLHVHPNTFRYRLRRAVDVGALDLDDPDVRFGIQLQLRVLGPGSRAQ
ncbi:helix-turn-helix domain-containing protein [Kribbella sp. NPDC026596]|uniref:PucR family transcriptional regulator n=1 Tax=Kribbella sp. NPDC026596 TaxID=3155122 RepID=UPI0033CF6824